jgi:hypothetical protein
MVKSPIRHNRNSQFDSFREISLIPNIEVRSSIMENGTRRLDLGNSIRTMMSYITRLHSAKAFHKDCVANDQMEDHYLPTLFDCVLPFRDTLLSMLAPFEISQFIAALSCSLSPWEQKEFLDVLDDIFEDSSVIHRMASLGMTVRIFGADLETLQVRLRYPCNYLAASLKDRSLHIFVLVTNDRSETDERPTLMRDYRHQTERSSVPLDMDPTELHTVFESSIADEIADFSRWILCAPYLSGTLPGTAPGWIPVFNSRPHVNVKAFITTFDDPDGRILHMNRDLMRQVFGYHDNGGLLYNLPHLATRCIKLKGSVRITQGLPGKFTMNVLHDILAAAHWKRETENDKFVIVNTAHPLNSSITLALE